ncbi:serine hydrolase domain-containing protein [Halalkalibacterium ligniniphilum]|uniref:serine hydrolase domain-containing protein n=1 Tax=Halalkalibacterium ligniniphilum TaxID=1134413 RepID=UPI0003463950|nr:serine hydrolase domain-containing protein [Halalkalibacterium ligniniphilum]
MKTLSSELLKETLDSVLSNTVNRIGAVPGVVAMVTDRKGIIYEGAAGVRQYGTDISMTTDSIFALFSTTKAITGATVMQLVEEGSISLDDPVKNYVPEIAEIPVLNGFDSEGNPKLTKQKTDITIRMLLLHTAGFSYDFFSHEEKRYREHSMKEVPNVLSSSFESIKTPLLFQPGESWNYGTNIDWAGKVVEAVRGKRLGSVMKERIFEPLGMNDTSFVLQPSMDERRVSMHFRSEDGTILAKPDFKLPDNPQMDMGGHGLYGTVKDYMKFIRMILNDGEGVLKPDTVKMMSSNGLDQLKSGGWDAADPSLANKGEFFPGLSKSWGYTFQINDEAAPTGRPAGQLMWAGLPNCYYWIDLENGIGGYWASQIFPYHDASSYLGYLEFESAVYNVLSRNK